MPSQKQLPVTLYSNIMTPKISHSVNGCNIERFCAVFLQEGHQVHFANKSPSHMKRHMLQFNLSFQRLPKSFSLKQTKSYLKVCIPGVLHKPLQGSSKNLMRSLTYEFYVRYIKGSTNQLADCLSRLDHHRRNQTTYSPNSLNKMQATSHSWQDPITVWVHCTRWWFVFTQTHCTSWLAKPNTRIAIGIQPY